MVNYETLYFGLFNAMTDAPTALEAQNYGTAREIMVAAQQKAEDAYLEDGEE